MRGRCRQLVLVEHLDLGQALPDDGAKTLLTEQISDRIPLQAEYPQLEALLQLRREAAFLHKALNLIEAQVQLLQSLQLINAALVERRDPIVAQVEHDKVHEGAETVARRRPESDHIVR